MLTNLHVKNLALIDEAEVEFGPGLNILTGETGAGKSILIGSINAALGKKISREMIRTGETSALVELVFETENPHVLELLKEMDLEAEEGQVIISRKITGSRSVCRINGEVPMRSIRRARSTPTNSTRETTRASTFCTNWTTTTSTFRSSRPNSRPN